MRVFMKLHIVAYGSMPGVDNPADILTKPLAREDFECHRWNLGLVRYHTDEGEC